MTAHRKLPYRTVLEAVLNDDHLGRWWNLTLECGHDDVRPVSYERRAGVRWGGKRTEPVRSIDDVAPAPRRILCEECGLTAQAVAKGSPPSRSTRPASAAASPEPDGLLRSA